jgi:hypothetical protein
VEYDLDPSFNEFQFSGRYKHKLKQYKVYGKFQN